MQGPEIYGREAAAKAWNDLLRPLKWRSDQPQGDAYYWWEIHGIKRIDRISDPEKWSEKGIRLAGPIPEPWDENQ